jgi:hypothetical protein
LIFWLVLRKIDFYFGLMYVFEILFWGLSMVFTYYELKFIRAISRL